MDKRNKKNSLLSERQKRRRLSIIRNARHDTESDTHDSDDSHSSAQERLDHEEIQIPHPFELGDYSQNSDEAQSADEEEDSVSSDENTVSSNEGGSEEENEVFDGDISVENLEENNHTSESDSSGDENQDPDVEQNLGDLQRRILKNAFLSANIKNKQGMLLLKVLREFPFNLISLPKDPRTLLGTPTIVVSTLVQQIAGGKYLHIGFKSTLIKKLESLPRNMLPDHIEIDLSTDGAKVDKGMDQFWPHQYRIFNIRDKRPIIAGIYQGRHKPSNPFEFYEQLVQEIVNVREEGGISIGNRRLPVIIRSFIADAPARAFALNHYGHTSANACSKCKVEGHRCTVPGFRGTMVFEGTRHPLRTDAEYQNLIDEDHHKGRSPLAVLLGLVTRVPFESLHLLWLGNVKKVIQANVEGKFGHQRLNGRKLNIIDSRMRLLQMYCPSEFNRRPNEITMLHYFKGTEWRQLLLYTAPAVLKNVFPEDLYNHFMILHSVIRLLISEETPQEMFPFCQEAMESYVTLCEQLYGQQFMSYNVHGLLHVVADVEELGGLETFSAFCFENNMPQLRKCVRKPHLKLPQVYKRMHEQNDLLFAPVDNNNPIRLSQVHADGPVPDDIAAHLCQQFRKLEVDKFTFATTMRDSCCILQDLQICLIKNIIRLEEEIFLIVQKFRTTTAIYCIGVPSDAVGVYHCANLLDRHHAVNLNLVKGKSYRMPQWSSMEGEEEQLVENEWICVTLLTPVVFPEH